MCIRDSNKGVKPVRKNNAGDLLCRVQVEVPINLTSEQTQLFEQLRGTLQGKKGSKHTPQSSGWLDGVKNFFNVRDD